MTTYNPDAIFPTGTSLLFHVHLLIVASDRAWWFFGQEQVCGWYSHPFKNFPAFVALMCVCVRFMVCFLHRSFRSQPAGNKVTLP